MRTRTIVMLTVLALLPFGFVLAVQLTRDDGGAAPAPRPADELVSDTLPDQLEGTRAPRVRLRDQDGEIFDSHRLGGRPFALTFLFTRCPDVCPLIGQELRAALEALGEDGERVRVAAVSVDPRGDTPEAVRDWVRRQRLPEQFRYLVGSEDQLQPIWDAYYAAPEIRGRPETSTHTAAIFLFDGEGRWRGRFSAGEYLDPADLARDLRLLVRESDTATPR